MIYSKTIRYLFVLLIISTLLPGTALALQCQATTKKGTQCKRKAQDSSNYCFQHKSISDKVSLKKTISTQHKSTSLSPKENSQESKTNDSAPNQCQAITKKGNRCSRSAKSNSNYCKQHNK
ncbi:hypothetical protein HY745_09535 [Candidatus Desantisbacteria bacterium]|nr:hypothetical protein [Candidatus Desantisbacteria bacterium]